jgi:hypothetical protein
MNTVRYEDLVFSKRQGGNAAHYVARTADALSPGGYVNICYNLLD